MRCLLDAFGDTLDGTCVEVSSFESVVFCCILVSLHIFTRQHLFLGLADWEASNLVQKGKRPRILLDLLSSRPDFHDIIKQCKDTQPSKRSPVHLPLHGCFTFTPTPASNLEEYLNVKWRRLMYTRATPRRTSD